MSYRGKCTILTDPDTILNEEVQFYKTLYTEPSSDQNIETETDYFLKDNHLPKIENELKIFCDEQITIEECGLALKQLSNNKSPGSDGFPTEFYKFFWQDIKCIVYDSYNFAFKNGKLSSEQRRGILSIIPKKDKDLRWLKNWRPLSLLNTDYKILTKILATRLQKVVDSIISQDQSGYIKGRFIGENVRTIADIIEYTSNTTQSGLIALLDFEKAFDSINWYFLQNTLKTFNFGQNFIKWISVIYADISSCCLNNGNATPFFNITRGVRQGCPISALLFVLIVEVMANKIRSNENIPGIYLNKREIKISQLADDTTLFLKNETALDEAFILLEKFKTCSGLKLNKSKTEIFYLGNTNHRPMYNTIKTTKKFKALGIYFTKDINNMSNINLDERFNKFINVLNIWKRRDLSLKGKITIVKSLALPQLIYVTNVVHVPEQFITNVDKEIRNFVWNGKPAKVKTTTMIGNFENGGLKMPHFSTIVKSQKIMWIKRLCKETNSNWQNIAWKQMGISKDQTFSKYSLKYIDKAICSSPFYRQILYFWFDFYSAEPDKLFIWQEKLWHNKFILIGHKPAFYKEWQTNGINTLKDIIHATGIFLTKEQLRAKYKIDIQAMSYNSLIHAIPQNWKKVLKERKNELICNSTESSNLIYIADKQYNMHTLTNKTIYWHLLNRFTKQPTAIDKWISEFPFLNDKDFEYFFLSPHFTIKETKLQSFQYKILNRIIPCRDNLFKWKLTENNTCLYCKEQDTLTHYICECSSTSRFWKSLETWIQMNMHSQLPLAKCDIIFGVRNIEESALLYCLNYIIIQGKWFIYKCKTDNKHIFFLDFLTELNEHILIEKYILLTDENLDKFMDKLGPLYEALFI